VNIMYVTVNSRQRGKHGVEYSYETFHENGCNISGRKGVEF
jgi:hypothetical protein